MDTRLLKDSFTAVAPRAGELVEYFYADLFSRGGQQVRDMFPPAMTAQRDRLLGALIRTVTGIDDLEATAGYLAALGRDHRKYGADQEQAYVLVGASLLNALEHFAGEAWTPEVAATWAEAYGLISSVMLGGAQADEAAGNPPWWNATVLDADRRGPDITVLTLRLGNPLSWLPGQSVSVLFDEMPWRFYSPANLHGEDPCTLELHVHAVPGGMTSAHLVQHAVPGSEMRIGPAVGSFTLDTSSGSDIVMAAHSTGLAPVKAIIRQLAALPDDQHRPRVHLWFGARDPAGLYDLEDLGKLAAEHPWLSFTHVVTAGQSLTPGYTGLHGWIPDLITGRPDGAVAGRDAYVAGPGSFVAAVSARMHELGAASIRTEDYAWEGSING
jgi:NAD(P)H-flavin reductase